MESLLQAWTRDGKSAGQPVWRPPVAWSSCSLKRVHSSVARTLRLA